MADSPRSSFIPKQSTGAAPTVKRRRRFNVLNFIASIVLVGSLILAIGTFFYKDYSSKQLVEQKAALEAERNRFSEGDIVAVREFDRRLSAATFLLDQHLSPSKILRSLELTTKETIQFSGLSYTRNGTDAPEVTLSGLTEQFASVALQSLAFEDDPVMRDASFTGLNTTDSLATGEDRQPQEQTEEQPRVGFSVEGSIAPASIAFDGNGVQRDGNDTTAPDASTETESGTSTPDTATTPNTPQGNGS